MMTDKLKKLEENLFTLEIIKDSYTVDDIICDKVDEWGLRYGLFESIQIIIDISCHIVAEKNLGSPKSYSDCISFLVSNKYLDEKLGGKIINMIGLRNLLIHEYGIINVNRLFEYLNHLADIKDFVNAIKNEKS
ncbi:MAG: type VII toxin-antitoxin system HepT family RNase toxin [Ignavibacteriaceae bacterium]